MAALDFEPLVMAFRYSRKWKTHAIWYDPRWLLIPSIEVLYLPISPGAGESERPGQVWFSIRFLAGSIGFGFFFWNPKP